MILEKPNVGPNSWILLKVAGVKKEDVENWKSQENSSNFGDFKDFVKKIACVNDFAERNIKLTKTLWDHTNQKT